MKRAAFFPVVSAANTCTPVDRVLDAARPGIEPSAAEVHLRAVVHHLTAVEVPARLRARKGREKGVGSHQLLRARRLTPALAAGRAREGRDRIIPLSSRSPWDAPCGLRPTALKPSQLPLMGQGGTAPLRTLPHPAGAPLAQQAAGSGAACEHHVAAESQRHHVYAPK